MTFHVYNGLNGKRRKIMSVGAFCDIAMGGTIDLRPSLLQMLQNIIIYLKLYVEKQDS